MGAIVVVNSAGSPVNPADCSLWGAQFGIGGEFAGLSTPTPAECHPTSTSRSTSSPLNTTIAVVVTNLPMEKAAAERLAADAQDGMARAISPIHTLADGDTVFGATTGTGTPLRINNPADDAELNNVFDAGSTALSRAIAKAVLSATSVDNMKSYCDTYPSACKNFTNVQTWRTEGEAPEVTPQTFRAASKHLAVLAVPKPKK